MFSKFFINRPIFATVLALLIVVAGLVALNILPVAQFPEITPPTVQVSAVYPGANAETVAQTVGLPIEQQVNGVDGMLYMSSNSSSSGAYSLTITFAVGTDIDMATVQVQNRVSVAQSSLPEPVVVQGVTVQKLLVMALIVAFLVLAAQYESWTSPVAAVIGLPVALLGAMIGCMIMGTPVSVYTQIGIILLVALSAKNGILIVEFARDFRAEGNSIREAAYEAGHVRLRPILMTSFAFVLGVMPLLFATGAGAQSRIALGTAVVFGMAMNTLLATVYIPNFYELMQKLQEKFSRKKDDDVKKDTNM